MHMFSWTMEYLKSCNPSCHTEMNTGARLHFDSICVCLNMMRAGLAWCRYNLSLIKHSVTKAWIFSLFFLCLLRQNKDNTFACIKVHQNIFYCQFIWCLHHHIDSFSLHFSTNYKTFYFLILSTMLTYFVSQVISCIGVYFAHLQFKFCIFQHPFLFLSLA